MYGLRETCHAALGVSNAAVSSHGGELPILQLRTPARQPDGLLGTYTGLRAFGTQLRSLPSFGATGQSRRHHQMPLIDPEERPGFAFSAPYDRKCPIRPKRVEYNLFYNMAIQNRCCPAAYGSPRCERLPSASRRQ